MSKRMKPYLFWVLLVFLGVGLVYPVIGLLALSCMLAPVLVAPFRGRHWCGNYCPRGSFYDQVMVRVSPRRKIPALFSHGAFRALMLVVIMSIFAAQMVFAWGDLAAMGEVFVRIILITTLVGVGLSLVYHQRTWCSFCPMGTMASWISRARQPRPLAVADSCVNCGLCTKACPMQLAPYEAKGQDSGFTHPDCLKCGRCAERCPRKAIDMNPGTAAIGAAAEE